MEEKWTPFGIDWSAPAVRDAFKAQQEVAQRLSNLLSLGVGVDHINRCSKIGYALGIPTARPNSEVCCDFLDDCAQRISAGMPMDEFCGYIDNYENHAIGIEKAPRTINTPYFVSVKPVSVGYSVGDLATEIAKVAKQADEPKKKPKNALGFLDGLYKRKF